MPDKNSELLAVAERLRMALDVASDVVLAERLGMKYSAWSMRKTRGALPTEHIDALVKKEGLNPEYIYEGTGPVHLDIDVESWEAGFRKRLAQMLGGETYAWTLVQQGHTSAEIKAVQKGKEEPTPRLLRDMQKHLGIDLNWLVSGDTKTQLSKDEDALLALYRKATKEGQAFITQAAGMAKTQREVAAHQHRELVDPKTGKFVPGAQTTPDAEGFSVRVPLQKAPKRASPARAPKPAASKSGTHAVQQNFHGEIKGDVVGRDKVVNPKK